MQSIIIIRNFIVVLILSLYSVFVSAEEVQPYTLVKAGTLIDGTGKAPIHNGAILIHKGLIEAVGPVDTIKVPENTKVIDLKDKTIMPTLIAAHSHLGMIKGITASDSNNTEQNVLRQLRLYAQYGVGAVVSLGRDQEFIYKLRADRNSGKLDSKYAYIITAGQGLGVPYGAPPKLAGPDPVYRPKTSQEIARDLDALAQKKTDIVKIWVDDFYGSLPKMKPEIYQDIIKEAHKRGMRVAAHIYYLEDAKRLIDSHVDVLEHSVRDKVIDDALVKEIKDRNIAIVPTLDLDEDYFIYTDNPKWMHSPFFTHSLEPGVLEVIEGKKKIPSYVPKQSERQALDIAMKNIKKLYDAGVPVGLGSDSGAKIERAQGFSEHRELQLLVKSGLTPMEALQVGTQTSAKIMHVDKEMGTLQRGKKANLLVLNANPLDDIKNTEQISSVWLDGKEISKGPLAKDFRPGI